MKYVRDEQDEQDEYRDMSGIDIKGCRRGLLVFVAVWAVIGGVIYLCL